MIFYQVPSPKTTTKLLPKRLALYYFLFSTLTSKKITFLPLLVKRKEQKKRPSVKRQTSGAIFIQSLLFTVDGWPQYLVWHWGEPVREFPPTKPIPPPPACLRGAPLYFFLSVKQITLGRGVKPFTTQAALLLGWGSAGVYWRRPVKQRF